MQNLQPSGKSLTERTPALKRRGLATVRVGKRIRGVVYVHESALPLVEAELTESQRATLNHGRSEFAGTGFNVFRFERSTGRMALLRYPQFFDDPFPKLQISKAYDPASGEWRERRYDHSDNPPILHRKELLLAPDHGRRAEFEALTRSLEERDLFAEPSRIGFLQPWRARLEGAGLKLDGHRVVAAEQADRAAPIENVSVHRHRTALTRYALSAPIQALGRYGYLDGNCSLFDYGCGKGGDVEILRRNNVRADGWDPHYHPDAPLLSADIVNLGYVINVIENADERSHALLRAYELTNRLLCISAMLDHVDSGRGREFGDGVLTSRQTFQKFYRQEELRDFIASVLDDEPVPVKPGIFFVFKDKLEEQRFFEQRQRNRSGLDRLISRIPKPTREERERVFYSEHQAILDPLWGTWISLGRKPRNEEVPDLSAIRDSFGTLARALGFLSRFYGDERIRAAFDSRRNDLTVFFALREFERRRKYRSFPDELQRDVRAFFGSLAKARCIARDLLFSAGESTAVEKACKQSAENGLGWLDGEHALQLHTSLISQLPPVLRVYIGCASRVYGDVTSADLVKIHIASGKLTLMSFEDFEDTPLPRMTHRVKIRLRDQKVEYYEYGADYAPPYLYRKSRFITEDFPKYQEQMEFDQALEGCGLFDLSGYGPSQEAFEHRLAQTRLKIEGFALKPQGLIPQLDEHCGEYLTFRQLIECGETQRECALANVPREAETYSAFASLAVRVLDPAMDFFGGIELTYGFCSRELAKRIPGRIDPSRDQHAGYEKNTRGKLICGRSGAAVDFLVRDESMLEVAQWIAANTPFDRLYFYGDDRPVHVSVGPAESRQVVLMLEGPSGRRVPRVVNIDEFRSWDGEKDSLARHGK